MPLKFSECTNPWTFMFLYPEQGGCVGPCCHFAPPGGTIPFDMKNGESLELVWNSDRLQQLRRSIIAGEPRFDTCKTCPTLMTENSFGPDPANIMSMPDLTDAQRDNARAALGHFTSGDFAITSAPLFYMLRFGCACNLRCIMCNHEAMKENHGIGSLDFEWLKAQENFFTKAYLVTVTGGEPLFIKSGREFISWFLNNDKLRTVDFHICTNGILLDTVMHLMKDHNVTLEVSIDSFGELYERIRPGASWKRLTDNIDAFLELKKGQKPNNFLVRVHCTLTLTGLPGLPDLVRWVVKRKMGMHFAFMEIREYIETFEESLLEHPRWMEQKVPNWESIFKESINILRQEEIYSPEADQLNLLYNQLLDRYRDPHSYNVDLCFYEERMHALWKKIGELQSAYDYDHNDQGYIGALRLERDTFRHQRDLLLASRWRKLGRKLGIVKTPPFELAIERGK